MAGLDFGFRFVFASLVSGVWLVSAALGKNPEPKNGYHKPNPEPKQLLGTQARSRIQTGQHKLKIRSPKRLAANMGRQDDMRWTCLTE